MNESVVAHGKSWGEFEAALAEALAVARLTPRTAIIRAGSEVYARLLRSEEDGPHATLRGVGWMRLQLDASLDPWAAAVVEREES